MGILLFRVTGTPESRRGIPGDPRVSDADAQLPAPLLESLQTRSALGSSPLPRQSSVGSTRELPARPRGRPAEWSVDEV